MEQESYLSIDLSEESAMKRTRTLVLVAGLILALVVPLGMVLAAGPSTYGSAFQLQNLEDATANITIKFYNTDGSVATTITDTISASGSNNYFAVLVSGLPDPFSGSAVVSSDKELRAIHNLYGDDLAFGGAASAGYTAGSADLSLPLIMRNNSGYTTWFSVQNAGSVASTTAVTFTAGSVGSNYTPAAVTIEPGASYRFDQADTTQLGDVFIGSARIVSTNGQPLVATAVEVGPASLFAYDGFSSVASTFVVPLFHYNNAGYVSSINVQNAGNQDTTVTISYAPSDDGAGGTYGTACQETQTVAAGASATFGLYAFVSVDPPGAADYVCDCHTKNPGTRFIGSGTVSANTGSQSLVAVVNQLKGSTGHASAYNAFGPNDGSQCASLPLVMDRNSNYWTSINIVNVGSASTTVTIEYSANAKSGSQTYGQIPDDEVFSLDAGKSRSILHAPGADPILDDYVGSARVCGANSNDELLMIVNELNVVASGDTLYTYNGFNLD